MEMKVTKVWVNKYESGKLLGFADIQFNGYLIWKGFKLFRGDDGGIQLSFPTKVATTKDNKSVMMGEDGRPIYHPVITLKWKDNPEGQAFLGYLVGEVTEAFEGSAPQERQQTQQTTQQQGNSNVVLEEDIPF